MAALKIYGSPFSPFVARVLMAANAKGVKYVVSIPEGGVKGPLHLKLNPFGKVPVMEDGNFSLYESSVIVDYIDAKVKTKPLVPKSAKAAAPLRLIAAVTGEYVQNAGLKIFRHWRTKSDDATALAAAQAELASSLDVLEKLLVKGKYAGGARFSIADCYVGPALWFCVAAAAQVGVKDIFGKRKKLKSYFASIQKDKIAKPVFAGMAERLQSLIAGA